MERIRPIGLQPHVVHACAGILAAMIGASAATADLNVHVSASPNLVRPGDKVDLEITVANDGPFARTDVSVSLDYPAGLLTLSNSLFDGSCAGSNTVCDAGEQAVFDIADLPAGKGLTFTMPVIVLGSAADGMVIPFDVDVIDDTVVQTQGGASVTVDSGRVIDLVLTENRSPAAPGGEIIFSIRYGVLTASPGSPGAVLRMPVPAGTSFISATGGGADTSGMVEWTLGNLNPGTVGERQARFQVNAGAAAGSIIHAEAHFEDAAAPMNQVRYDTAVRVENEIPLELVVTASPDPVREGQIVDLEMTVTNTGLLDRSNVELRLEYPQGLSTLSNSLFDGACAGSNTVCNTGERAAFSLGTIGAGEGRTVTMPITILGSTSSGRVIPLKADLADSTGDQRRSATSVAVKDDREVNLALTDDRDPAEPDSRIAYTLTYGVTDTSAGSPGAALRMPVPAGTTFVSATGGGALSGNAVEWSLGNINPGVSGERQVVFEVDSAAPMGSQIVAEAAFVDGATPANEVRSYATTRVQSQIPLEVVVIAGQDPIRQGETIDLELTVTNTGAFDRTGVVLRMEYPGDLFTFSNSLFAGSCSGSNTVCDAAERAVFNLGTLRAGEGVTFPMRPRVLNSAPSGSVVVFEADVTDNTGDWRRAGTNIAVDGARLLDVAMHESHEPILPGDLVTYTLTYGTLSTGAGAPDAMLRFSMPEGATFISASNAGKLSGDVVTWDVDSLSPGDGGERTVTVQFPHATPPGTILLAEVSIDSIAAAAREARFQESTRVQADLPLSTEITVTPAPAEQAEVLTLDLSVTNNTMLDRTGLVLSVKYPDGLLTLSNSSFDGMCAGSNTVCDAQEHATFDIPLLAAGQTVDFTMMPTISNGTPDGTVINFDAFVTDSTGFQAWDGDAIMVGALAPFSPACNCETDGDATQVDVFDLLAFLDDWFAGASAADLDGAAGVDVFDLLFFLDCWFPASAGTPCP